MSDWKNKRSPSPKPQKGKPAALKLDETYPAQKTNQTSDNNKKAIHPLSPVFEQNEHFEDGETGGKKEECGIGNTEQTGQKNAQ